MTPHPAPAASTSFAAESSGPAPVALVLGGVTGMLGQALVKSARAEGWRVHTLGRQDGPLTDPAFLERRLADVNPDYVFNTVAYTAVDDAEDHPEDAYAMNRGFPSLLGATIRGSSARLIHYSTDFVFNGKKHTPYTEEDPTGPLSVYGSSKLAGEQALLSLHLPNCCIVRTAWLFGPGRKNFVSTILRHAKTSGRLTVVHDQVGSPTFTGDLALMSLALAKTNAEGIVHGVNGGQASWCELASEAVSLAGLDVMVEPITSAQWPQKAQRPSYSVLCAKHLTELTGITPRPWPQALRDYIFQDLVPAHGKSGGK